MSQLIRVVKMVEGTSREDGGVLASSQSRGNSTHTPKRCARLHERIVKRQKHKRSTFHDNYMVLAKRKKMHDWREAEGRSGGGWGKEKLSRNGCMGQTQV